MHIPRIVISGLSGGAGKTMVSLGLARAFARRGKRVRAIKKGPDYIDAMWLALASGAPQANLDSFFSPGALLGQRFSIATSGYDLALVEGNRGLFDGLDISGSCSTAEVARLLAAPVLLVLDATKMTRTAAALVKGCLEFEAGVRIGGVIVNRIGNERHRAMVTRAIEELCGIPVLGALPRRAAPLFAERHMGLAGANENPEAPEAEAALEALADFLEQHVSLDAIFSLAQEAPEWNTPASAHPPVTVHPPASAHASGELGGTVPFSVGSTVGGGAPCMASLESSAPEHVECASQDMAEPSEPFIHSLASERPVHSPRIGVVRDAAFWFYYQENLDALTSEGARLVLLSLLDAEPWPQIDGLYIGGGLPELHVRELSHNEAKREHVAALCRSGLPVYAECGGLMYLSEALRVDGVRYPMAGVFPYESVFFEKPCGLGYVEASVAADTPFFPKGVSFRGHEFHFSRCLSASGVAPDGKLHLRRGQGFGAPCCDGEKTLTGTDGVSFQKTFASYTHIYAPAVPCWAPAFVALSAAGHRA